MTKGKIMRKSAALFFGLSLLFVTHASSRAVVKRTYPKETFDAFFQSWLIRKDAAKALGYFHADAFKNPALLSEECAGYIVDEDRDDAGEVKKGVDEFLKDFSGDINSQNITDVLITNEDVESSYAEFVGYPEALLNDPQKDRYFVLDYPAIAAKARDKFGYADAEKQFDLKSAYVTVAAIRLFEDGKPSPDVAVVYLLWTQQGADWKIAQANIVCI
jgi:hypothetical protein